MSRIIKYSSHHRLIGLLALVFILSFVFRLSGLISNTPFWVDEFSTGTSAMLIQEKGLDVFLDPPTGFETNNSMTYVITALLFSLFGRTEIVARIPMIIAGSLVPVAIFFLTKQLAGKFAGFIAAIFTATSYFQIVWSLQARSYMMLQLAVVLTLIFGIRLIGKSTVRKIDLAILFLLVIIGTASHYLYCIVLGVVILWFFIIKRGELIKNKKTLIVLAVFMALVFMVLWAVGLIESVWIFVNSSFFLSNNLWYYHPFLWREYGMLVMMTVFGFVLIAKKQSAQVGILITYCVAHLVFVTFFFGHHMSKYLLPVFPILFIGAGVCVVELSRIVAKPYGAIVIRNRMTLSPQFIGGVVALGFTLFIIGNGHKFIVKPKKYYSINHDYREIANIDYHEVYKIITRGITNSKENTVALVETWPDRALWYIKRDYRPLYIFRWQEGENLVSGHTKKTSYKVKEDGEKYFTDTIGFVGEAQDLKKIMKKYKKGYIFIDDDTLPRDVIDYAEKNLKKEIFLDHYPLDDNPYSLWPATLYSWGFE